MLFYFRLVWVGASFDILIIILDFVEFEFTKYYCSDTFFFMYSYNKDFGFFVNLRLVQKWLAGFFFRLS